LRHSDPVVVPPVTPPPGPAPKLSVSRGATTLTAGLAAPHARRSPPAEAKTHVFSHDHPATATAPTPPTTPQPAPPETTRPTTHPTTRPTTPPTTRSPAAATAIEAVALPRLDRGPTPTSLLTKLLRVLAGVFALTVLVHVANRSLSISRTFRGTPAARWLR